MNKLIKITIASISLLAILFSSVVFAAGEKYVLISHAPDSDSWWNTIKNALKEAEKDYGVRVDYRNPRTGDLADMARLIEQAAASNYDGVITTIADYNVLKSSIQKVIRKGIPVITMNSGTAEQSASLGALMHVGQPEYYAGLKAGERAKAAGVKSFLCVNHFATNPVSFERCRGFAEGIGADYKKSTIDSGQDPITIESKVGAYLRKNSKTDAVLTLGPTSAHPVLNYLKKSGKSGKIYFATFDTSPEILKGIKAGTIAFGIDQQPFLQAYIPVTMLVLRSRYGLEPGSNLNSGPGFITKDNVSTLEKHAGRFR